MSEVEDVQQKKPLSREDLEEQIEISSKEAQQSYDNYQKALGVVAACRHMLTRFEVPNRPKEEPKKLEEVK